MADYEPIPLPTAIIHEGEAAVRRLLDLGLRMEGVARALELALGDRLACTEFDPPSFHGQTRSARLVRYLREEYVTNHGWAADDTQNYSLLVSPDRSLAVQVATGNDATGDSKNSYVRLAHPKGEMTEKAVQRNAQQLSLFTGEADGTAGGPTTWILLVNERQGELFSELSWPEVFSHGQIEGWRERIILPSISYRGYDLVGASPLTPVSPTPTVQRRSSL